MAIRKKLTTKLRNYLKENYRSAHKKDYSGEALAYLNRVRGAAKSRSLKAKIAKERKSNEIVVGETVIPANSDLAAIIKEGAKQQKVSVKTYTKRHKEALTNYIEKGSIHMIRAVKNLKGDIKKAKTVRVNGKKVSKKKAQQMLEEFNNSFVENGGIYDIVALEHEYDMKGNLFLEFPDPDEYEGLEGEELQEYIQDNYPKINFISNDSKKKRRRKKK